MTHTSSWEPCPGRRKTTCPSWPFPPSPSSFGGICPSSGWERGPRTRKAAVAPISAVPRATNSQTPRRRPRPRAGGADEGRSGGVAIVLGFGHPSFEDLVHGRRKLRAVVRRRRWWLLEVCIQEGHVGVPYEGHPPGQAFEGHAGQRIL